MHPIAGKEIEFMNFDESQEIESQNLEETTPSPLEELMVRSAKLKEITDGENSPTGKSVFFEDLEKINTISIVSLDGDTVEVRSSSNSSLPIVLDQDKSGFILFDQTEDGVYIGDKLFARESLNSKHFWSQSYLDQLKKDFKTEKEKCRSELKRALVSKSSVQQSLHSCSKEQVRIRSELELDKSELNQLVDDKNSRILECKDINDEKALEISQLLDKIDLLKLEKADLQQLLEEQQMATFESEEHIRNYQDKVTKHNQFVAENTCLDPLIFWSGYFLAVIIVFLICIVHVVRHHRANRKKKPKPVQTMERIQVADIEHSHMKTMSSPNLLLPNSSRSSRRASKSSPQPATPSREMSGDEDEEKTLLPQTDTVPRLV